jgi:hypothetical protein
MGRCFRGVEFGRVRDISDDLMMHSVHNGLKPVVCSQLVVDVVEMVAECLQADPKFPRDLGGVLSA